jgi:hypothetical protein
MNRKLRKIFEQEDYSAEFQEIKGLIKKTRLISYSKLISLNL